MSIFFQSRSSSPTEGHIVKLLKTSVSILVASRTYRSDFQLITISKLRFLVTMPSAKTHPPHHHFVYFVGEKFSLERIFNFMKINIGIL